MATWKIQEIIKQAVKTFSIPLSNPDLSPLIALVNKLTPADIPIKKSFYNLDYQSIYSDSNVTIGIFILKEGCDIPLHDHPDMYGLLKVLRGVIEITSYTLKGLGPKGCEKGPLYYMKCLPATKEEKPIVITNTDSCSIVHPVKNNIHRVLCLKGPAAFLDILSPPYSNDLSPSLPRSCHYFKEYIDPVLGLTLVQVPERDDSD